MSSTSVTWGQCVLNHLVHLWVVLVPVVLAAEHFLNRGRNPPVQRAGKRDDRACPLRILFPLCTLVVAHIEPFQTLPLRRREPRHEEQDQRGEDGGDCGEPPKPGGRRGGNDDVCGADK